MAKKTVLKRVTSKIAISGANNYRGLGTIQDGGLGSRHEIVYWGVRLPHKWSKTVT